MVKMSATFSCETHVLLLSTITVILSISMKAWILCRGKTQARVCLQKASSAQCEIMYIRKEQDTKCVKEDNQEIVCLLYKVSDGENVEKLV